MQINDDYLKCILFMLLCIAMAAIVVVGRIDAIAICVCYNIF